MINPLTPADVVRAIGLTARGAARSDAPADDFARGQLMSAYSGSRHLAVEIDAFEPELRQMVSTVAGAVRAAGITPPLDRDPGGLEASTDPAACGEAVCDLLATLRADPSPAAAVLRAEVRRELARMCDREVELLADAIERETA